MLDPAIVLSLANSSSSSSSAEDFLPTSLRSGCGLALVGRVCSRQPPEDSSSLSLEFLHFIRRFWNQIFTCGWGGDCELKSSASEAVDHTTASLRGNYARDVGHLWCLPVSLSGPASMPASSCPACWCISVSGTFSPKLCAAHRRRPPSSAFPSGVYLWRPEATKRSREWE